MLGVFLVGVWVAFNPSHAVDPIAYRWIDDVVEERTYDTISDDSYQRFLDKEHFFSEITYEPKDLKTIESVKRGSMSAICWYGMAFPKWFSMKEKVIY